ncbi:unnamed protein product, partial [Pelagomonas calceolata]
MRKIQGLTLLLAVASHRVKRVGRKRVRGPPRIFASGFDNFSSFRSAPMHMTLGPRR